MNDSLKIRDKEIKREKSGDIVVSDDTYAILMAIERLVSAIQRLK